MYIIIYLIIDYNFCLLYFFCRKKAEVTMEGQFLVRQIYDDEITYNLIGAAVEILSKFFFYDLLLFMFYFLFFVYIFFFMLKILKTFSYIII